MTKDVSRISTRSTTISNSPAPLTTRIFAVLLVVGRKAAAPIIGFGAASRGRRRLDSTAESA